MASSPALPTQPAEEAARKREVRLMKNRYIRCIYLGCDRSGHLQILSDNVSFTSADNRIFAMNFFLVELMGFAKTLFNKLHL